MATEIGVADRVGEDLKLALLAMFLAATGPDKADCATIVDRAAEQASIARGPLIAAAEIGDAVGARFGAARAINTLCSACGGCARGRPGEREPVMAQAPGPPPKPR